MKRTKFVGLVGLCGALVLGIVSCSSDGEKAAVFESCSSTADCDAGLTCETEGTLAGRCALKCTSAAFCSDNLDAKAAYLCDSVCVQLCALDTCSLSANDTCASGLTCGSTPAGETPLCGKVCY
jgi:hypothetical protein